MNSHTNVLVVRSPSSSKCSKAISKIRSQSIWRTSVTRAPERCLRSSIHSMGGSSGLFFLTRVMWARAQPALAENSTLKFSLWLRMVKSTSSRSGCTARSTRAPTSASRSSRARKCRVNPSIGIFVSSKRFHYTLDGGALSSWERNGMECGIWFKPRLGEDARRRAPAAGIPWGNISFAWRTRG